MRIKAWGRGIRKIFDVCRTESAPEPEIRLETNGLWFEFPFKESVLALTSESSISPLRQETTQETTQEKIIRLIQEKPSITRRELAAITNMTPDGIKYHLDNLRRKGIIRHTGPTKAGKWEILS